jgi:Peptidase family M1 domain
MNRMITAAAVLAATVASGAAAQDASIPPTSERTTPEALASAVMRAFESGDADAFAALYPDSAGRAFMRSRAPKRADLARVVWRDGDRAVLLLAGTTTTGNGAARTNNARHFSGFYEAAAVDGDWTVTRKLPFDSANHIRAQTLHVDLAPGEGIDVVDTLDVSVGVPYGFAFRINSDVAFDSIRLDGRAVEHAAGGGIVWIDAPASAASELVLSYALAAPRSAADSAGPPAFGAYHNTDLWHPAFDYMSAHQIGRLTATVRIPAAYHLTTTVPQTETVRDGVRTVRGATAHNEFLLALIFDRDWQPRATDFGAFRFESFTTPAFRHSHDTLAVRVKHLYDLLTPRFGEPKAPARYLAAVEDRALGPRGGFNVAMNSAAISGGGGSSLGSERSQIFAHEVGHAWTMNATGLASNFLREGWARFAESLVLRDLYGADAELDYWEAQRNAYMVGNDRGGWEGGFEGRQSILGDFDNGRIHYTKGSWILRGANWALGDAAFEYGMRRFIAGMGNGPSGYEELIAGWSEAAGTDMAPFVMPWLTGRHIPDIDARVEDDRLIVTQQQPGVVFLLPQLEIALHTATDTALLAIDLAARVDTLPLQDLGPVAAVHVDPNHRYLIQRKWGEVVRFEVPAASLPGAADVHLAANFLRQGVTLPATRDGDRWVVDVPLTAGRYVYAWAVPDEPGGRPTPSSDPALSGTRVVEARIRVQDPYPGR